MDARGYGPKRELHSYTLPGSGGLQAETQYWQFSTANGWQRVAQGEGQLWDDCRYIDWPQGIPAARGGFPPREWI